MLYCTNEKLDLKISFFSAENLHHILFSFTVMINNMRDRSSILDMVTIDSYIIDF